MSGRGHELARIDYNADKKDYDVVLSPDGTRLALTTGHEELIHILSLRGQPLQEIRVKGGWTRFEDMEWAADSKGCLLRTASQEQPLRDNPVTGTPQISPTMLRTQVENCRACVASFLGLRAEIFKSFEVPAREAVFPSGCHDPVDVLVRRRPRNHGRTDVAKSGLPIPFERFSKYRLR